MVLSYLIRLQGPKDTAYQCDYSQFLTNNHPLLLKRHISLIKLETALINDYAKIIRE